MVRKKPFAKEQTALTEVELEIMQILWRIKSGTVRDILAELPEERDLAYTSVSTMVRILEKKGYVSAVKEGKTHTYYPIVKQADYQQIAVSYLLKSVFDDTPTDLIAALVNSKKVDSEELNRIRETLANWDKEEDS